MTKVKEQPARPPTNEEMVMRAFHDAGCGVQMDGIEIHTRTGVKNPYAYLASLAGKKQLVRVSKGVYTLPSVGAKPIDDECSSIDERVAEDIRAVEGRRILTEAMKLFSEAVPQETKDYLKGYEAGAKFMLEAITKDVTRLGVRVPH